MKRTVVLIIVLIIIAFCLLIFALNSQPKSMQNSTITISPGELMENETKADTTLGITPEELTLDSNDIMNLSVNIDSGINDITGVQLEIAYDKDVLSDVKINQGTFLPQANILFQDIDTETGRITFALVLPPSVSPVRGQGIVAQINAKKNLQDILKNRTAITILEKTLVSALGVEGSVLKSANNALVTFQTNSGTPSANLTASPLMTPTP